MIIAFDFDDTLFRNDYPKVGKPNYALINKAIRLKEKGHKLILWTCRSGRELEEAVDACRKVGLEFDAVNENVNPRPNFNPRKVFAQYYIDDRNLLIEDVLKEEI